MKKRRKGRQYPTHADIEKAIKDFLKRGGRIKRLKISRDADVISDASAVSSSSPYNTMLVSRVSAKSCGSLSHRLVSGKMGFVY